jgi:hypothetical protein
MPDRAIIPLLAAGMGGFLGGVIMAVTEADSGPELLVGLLVGAAVFAAGVVSVAGTEGESGERWIVGTLRGATATATFGFLYVGLIGALRTGSVLGILALFVAGFFGVLLTRFCVRERGELHPGH